MGPLSDLSRVAAPLIRELLASGAARPDPLNLGIEVSGEGAVIDAAGCAASNLFAVGPLNKGVFWETTAVPDIRVQCERLADHILERVAPKISEDVPAKIGLG